MANESCDSRADGGRATPGPPAAASPPPATAVAAVAAVRPAAAAGRPAGPGPPGLEDAFTPLEGAQVRLATVTVTVPLNPVQPERRFLSPSVVTMWSRDLPTDPFFGPIFKSAASIAGGAVICRGHPVAPATERPAGGASSFAAACSIAEGRGQWTGCACLTGGGGGMMARILQECHRDDTPLAGNSAATRRLVQFDGQRPPAQALLPLGGRAPLPRPGHGPGPGGGVRGRAAPQPQDGPRPDLLPRAVAGPRLGGRLVGAGRAPRLPGAGR